MLDKAMNKTLQYYNLHASTFTADTVCVDFHETQDRFLQYLPDHARILDFGCGAGRDTLYFLEHGYFVDAVDGSEVMCHTAEGLTGIPVRQMLFQELDAVEEYDGIWACASVLHLPQRDLCEVLSRMIRALKRCGIMYLSFKYGTFEGERKGRFFIDLTEERFLNIMKSVHGADQLRTKADGFPVLWITNDVRPDRSAEQWLNVLMKKN